MTFDLELARQCLDASALAYREASHVDEATSTEVLLVRIGDTLLIAFRGSREPRDYLEDAKFIGKRLWTYFGPPRRVADGFVKVHRGFFDGFNASKIRLAIATDVARLKPARIVCTGHSLGGGRAILCAAYLKALGYPVEVITFGCPRVGNGQFRDWYNEVLGDVTFRCEAQGDFVPFLPPYLLPGYRHVGREVYLTNDHRIEIQSPLLARTKDVTVKIVKLAQPDEWRAQAMRLVLFKPHYVENYQRLFAELKEAA